MTLSDQTSATPTKSVSPERLPQTFGLYQVGSDDHDLTISLEKNGNILFFLAVERGAYDPMPSITLFRGRGSGMVGGRSTRFGSIATATMPRPPFNTGLDLEIRIYDPNRPPNSRDDDKPAVHEKMQAFRSPGGWRDYPNIAFNYQISGSEKEQFEWIWGSNPEVRELDDRKREMKLVRLQTGEMVAAFAKPERIWRQRKLGEVVF